MRPAVFLDRDGVINFKASDDQFITRWEDFVFLPRVIEAIQLLNGANFLVVVVTNQRCVGEGLLTQESLESIHRNMVNACAAAGATIDAVFYCPHDRDSGCDCRKPLPGLLFEASRQHSIDFTSSWMVGDSDSDIQAGKNAGCKTARILRPGSEPEVSSDVSCASLYEAVQIFLAQQQSSPGS
jgi:D-glycero-D-manno-heptose 1,7-bisphosphate phosphatase